MQTNIIIGCEISVQNYSWYLWNNKCRKVSYEKYILPNVLRCNFGKYQKVSVIQKPPTIILYTKNAFLEAIQCFALEALHSPPPPTPTLIFERLG